MSKYVYDVSVFQKENNIAFYLLGAFCTDGCVRVGSGNSRSIVLTTKDAGWARQLNAVVAPNKPLKERLRKYSRIEWHSPFIADWLMSHGCSPRKSLTLKVRNIPEKYLPDFIRGCWDGDGTVGVYPRSRNDPSRGIKLKCALTTSSKVFAVQIQKYLALLAVRSSIHVRTLKPRKIGKRTITAPSVIYTIDITDKASINCFCRTVYYKNNKMSMSRKSAVITLLLSNSRYVYGKRKNNFSSL